LVVLSLLITVLLKLPFGKKDFLLADLLVVGKTLI
jgi:hypothetical protein